MQVIRKWLHKTYFSRRIFAIKRDLYFEHKAYAKFDKTKLCPIQNVRRQHQYRYSRKFFSVSRKKRQMRFVVTFTSLHVQYISESNEEQ